MLFGRPLFFLSCAFNARIGTEFSIMELTIYSIHESYLLKIFEPAFMSFLLITMGKYDLFSAYILKTGYDQTTTFRKTPLKLCFFFLNVLVHVQNTRNHLLFICCSGICSSKMELTIKRGKRVWRWRNGAKSFPSDSSECACTTACR